VSSFEWMKFSLLSRGVNVKSIRVVNILEEVMDDEDPVKWRQSGPDALCALTMRGFEIKTLRVEIEGDSKI